MKRHWRRELPCLGKAVHVFSSISLSICVIKMEKFAIYIYHDKNNDSRSDGLTLLPVGVGYGVEWEKQSGVKEPE